MTKGEIILFVLYGIYLIILMIRLDNLNRKFDILQKAQRILFNQQKDESAIIMLLIEKNELSDKEIEKKIKEIDNFLGQ